jgi:hypothetical protein
MNERLHSSLLQQASLLNAPGFSQGIGDQILVQHALARFSWLQLQ